MSAQVLSLHGGAIPFPDQENEPFEVDPALIDQLEKALMRARNGELLSFIMVYERPDDKVGCLYHTDDTADLSTLLVGMAVEQHRLTGFLADNTVSIAPPEEG